MLVKSYCKFTYISYAFFSIHQVNKKTEADNKGKSLESKNLQRYKNEKKNYNIIVQRQHPKVVAKGTFSATTACLHPQNQEEYHITVTTKIHSIWIAQLLYRSGDDITHNPATF